ncbi:MAG: hypothetical protein KAV87_50675, partial [Desulfobacteraceae bacterium]|nr:hypothetical protein [Desulfobacteraceae bacterium]
MASGTVTIRVRPLRVGFLVDPADRVGLYRAIELNTFLWGGSYNPIIPAYRRTPAKWESHRVRHLPLPSDIVDGYLNGFDPDLVVPVGICANRTFQVGNRDIVKADELIGDLKGSASPRYGIGLIELLNDFIEKELKYKRNDDLQVSFPELPRAYGLFLASVFGVLPKEAQQIVDKHFLNLTGISRVRVTINKFVELLRSPNFFPRRLTSWALEEQPLHGAQLFVCDATSTQDIIDYWNLRAAGFYVVPIPIQAAETESMKSLARDFIEKNFRPYRHNPEMFHHTTVQRSRSLTEDIVKSFCQSLNIPKNEHPAQQRYSLRWWYPRLWDTWARENAFGEGIAFPFAYEEERRISEGENRLELRSQDPKIETFRNYSGKPKFANEFSFRLYESKEPMAEVFPEGSRELSSAIGRTGYFHWRFSRFGPVFLANRHSDLIFLDLPLAEAVMTEWFRERGWKVSLSGPGRIAKQLLKQLGGTYGISQLAHKGVIELLADLEKEAGMPRQAVIEKLKHVVQSDGLFFDAERFLEGLISANALRLGTKIQCPVCTRYNWYELNVLDYELHCRFCLSAFSPPLKSPKDIQWTYRAHGPFASSIAQGAFTVLLTLKLLGGDFDQGVTPLFSYVAEKDGKRMEADLTCLYKPSTWRETGTYVIHAECKSFNRFERRDTARMKELAAAFAGSALIFATLNCELQESEVKLIRKLAVAERKKKIRGKPSSPVILLTGTELFSHRFTDKWENKGGAFAQLSQRSFELTKLLVLADATQQLHLNLP